MSASARRRYSPRLPRGARREQLLDVALRLIAQHGFTGVSMEAVAREADIAKTVVYDSFANRRVLLEALLEREQERALAAVAAAVPDARLTGDPLDILVDSLTIMLEAVHRNPETWRLILLPADGTPPALRANVERHRAQLLEQIEPIVAWGLKRLHLSTLDPELTAHAILFNAENLARLTLTEPERFTPRRIADFAAAFVAALRRA